MNHFDCAALSALLNRLATRQCLLSVHKMQGTGNATLEPENMDAVLQMLRQFRALFIMSGLLACARDAEDAIAHLQRPLTDISTVESQLQSFKVSAVHAIRDRKFLWIAEDRSEVLEEATGIDTPPLFGLEVATAFPSASRDIREAGNCLAVECCTASVFHLMRASEFALRALARDRRVEFSDRPLEEKEWGQILSNLEAKASGVTSKPANEGHLKTGQRA